MGITKKPSERVLALVIEQAQAHVERQNKKLRILGKPLVDQVEYVKFAQQDLTTVISAILAWLDEEWTREQVDGK